MMRRFFVLALCLVFSYLVSLPVYAADPAPAETAEENSGGFFSKLFELQDKEPDVRPVPRFVSLKATEANMRTGPGERYPITWVLKHKTMPLEVITEYDHWREIRDADGETGWVHKNMLSGKRTALIKDKPQNLLSRPDDAASVIAKLQPKVIVNIERCHNEWCEIEISKRDGFVRRTALWGVYEHEEIK
jgi:SH3-like domain-containing protein